MRKILLVFFLFFQVNLILCQTNPILHEKNLWSVLHQSKVVHIHPDDPYPFAKTTWYKIGKDTIIEAMDYKQLLLSSDSLKTTWSYAGSLRENEDKVYYLKGNSEILLYDFDLMEHDTIDLLLQNGTEAKYLLDSTGLHKTDKVELKKYNFSTFITDDPSKKIPEIWLEGIGSLNGFLREGCQFLTPCNDSFSLLCFYQNDTLIYSNPDYQVCFFDSLTLSINQNELNEEINVYPNPAQTKLTISSKSNVPMQKIGIYNLTGKKIYEKHLDESFQTEIDVSKIKTGIYIVSIESKDDRINRKISVLR